MKLKATPFLIALQLLAGAASAQYCPTLVDSPVQSYSIDDVPPAETQLINYQGAYFAPRPNHQVAFVQTGPNEQKIWFTIDAHFTQVLLPVFYNRRYRADANSPWYWEFSSSKVVIPAAGGSGGGFPDCVLYSPTARYAASDGVYYKYLMYFVFQPHVCDGKEFGFAMVSYSNDGICWTAMKPLHHAGGPSATCDPNLGGNLVQVEAISAMTDGTGPIMLIGMEGDVPTLVDITNVDWPYLSWGYSFPATSDQVTMDPTSAHPGCEPYPYGSHPLIEHNSSISKCGLSDVYTSDLFDPSDPYRYHPYSYAFNMNSAFDPATGNLYLTRGYPYPYDRHALTSTDSTINTPSNSQRITGTLFNSSLGDVQETLGCGHGPTAGYPNRYQVYRFQIGSLTPSGMATLLTANWTLVFDQGGSLGYDSNSLGSMRLMSGIQTPGSYDAGAASFLRDGNGQLVRTSGGGTVLAANTIREHLSTGPCQTTGYEAIHAVTLP